MAGVGGGAPALIPRCCDHRPRATPACQPSVSAARNSRSFGGLLSTPSTCGGTSPSATSRCPQPVSMMTTVLGTADLMALATLRPSTYGMPRSVTTAANGAPTSTAQQDVATQDVPPNVDVLDNGPCPGTDEGRAIVQVIHDVAPGVAQQFHTANNGLLDFAQGILELQEAGSKVIVDDSIYYTENMFSDGIVAQAAEGGRTGRGILFRSRQRCPKII